MSVRINFDKYNWKISFEGLDEDYKVDLSISEVNNIIEHEITLPDEKLIDRLIESFNKEGLLNPILVTKMENKYIIADGTHRLYCLRKIGLKEKRQANVLIYVLKSSNFKRESWVFVYNNALPLDEIKNAGFDIIEFKKSQFHSFYSSLVNGEIQAIIKTKNRFFRIIKKCKNRIEFLKSLKTLDLILGEYDNLIPNYDENEMIPNFAILAPPVDEKGDIELLIKYKELRRKKASKTRTPIRPLFFGIPLNILLSDAETLKKYIVNKIEDSIKRRSIIFVKSPIMKSGLINFIDYNILIIDKELFYKHTKKWEISEDKILDKYEVV
ncbi:MAG: hypothetical protein ACTSYR_00010 [Candidatus Odinarchaeia archaeon]